ncbi:hypothetical protein ES705_45388 [subsurface metagenome]
MKKQRNYDKRVKNTRILLSDYLVLKTMSLAAGVSMAEALHRLIEHQAQLPLPELRVTGIVPAIQVAIMPVVRTRPPISIATNGSKVAVFRIKSGGVKYE